jgi:acyl-CoA synthetase (NDP forming)
MVRTLGAGQKHPLGHAVGSTSLSQRAVEQVLLDCGLIVVDSIHEMLDVAQVATSQPLPTSGGLAIVGNSDALAVLAANACDSTPLSVVGEPVTFARQESSTAYEEAIKAAFADDRVGAVLAIYVPPIEHPSGDEIRATLRHCATAREPGTVHKPVVALMLGGIAAEARPDDVPAFGDVEDALRALASMSRYATWRSSPEHANREAESAPIVVTGELTLGPGEYHGTAAAAVLTSLGVGVRFQWQSKDLGFRVRLSEDPLFGPVVSVGLDDPVAEILDDRSYRLAPVTGLGSDAMLAELASLTVALSADATATGPVVAAVSALVAHVGRLAAEHPTVTSVDLRHVQSASVTGDTLVASDISVTIAESPVIPEPLARRL